MLRSARRVALGAVISLAALAAGSGVAQAHGPVDQQNGVSPGQTAGREYPSEVTQTFTAGRSGLLDGVDFRLIAVSGDKPATITVQILATSNGEAVGAPLTQQTVAGPPADASPNYFASVDFDKPAEQTAGTMYALRLLPSSQFAVQLTVEDRYSGGSLSPPPVPGTDLVFSTYVTSPSPSQYFVLNASGRPNQSGPYGRPAASPNALTAGQQYELAVAGTVSAWPKQSWAKREVCGVPESSPAGPVGSDANAFFARVLQPKAPCFTTTGTSDAFQVSTDGGQTYAKPTLTAVNGTQHTYTATVTGGGQPLLARYVDAQPQDNYGAFTISLQATRPVPAS